MLRVVLMAVLRAYRLLISPLYGQTCRYYPTCSAYALGSIDRHGGIRGSWLALRRLGRCHPWCAGGVDLVPEVEHYRWWGRAPGTDGETDTGDETVPADTGDEIVPADTDGSTESPYHPTEPPAPPAPVSDTIVARGA